MKVKDSDYADYQTERQWAKKRYLPVSGSAGVDLWANAYCQDSYTYDQNSRSEGAHNSLADCFTTLFVLQKMQENPENP